MIPELGHFALITAFVVASFQALIPLWGAQTGQNRLMAVARPAAFLQFALLSLAFACLTQAFVVNDFTVAYVAQNSNSLLPLRYRISAVWGAHEGSLLLWALTLAGWTAAVALFSRRLPREMVARVLGVMGVIAVGFLSFLLFTSNPFRRLLPDFPLDGGDLNPLLQDFGLIVHPPLLYMGYVGFSVAFAFAIAALLAGRLDSAWARWSRPWTTVAWCFLTVGIALGSWWAYYELGWGGWWFWDPVENASFMPWLVGTGLIHSLAVSEKRGVFKSWTVLLAIAAFSLSLLGTFLVRSGVLTSVHAFASDPVRGLFILGFLGVIVGGSLLIYALRAGGVRSEGSFELLSRETGLLLNNVILAVCALVILLGTLLPLLSDAFGWGKLSVGPPYFNTVFPALMVPLFFLMGAGAWLRWKRHGLAEWFRRARFSLALCLVLALGLTLWLGKKPMAVFGVSFLALWILAGVWIDLGDKLKHALSWTAGLRRLSRSQWGMLLAHAGIAVCALGAVFTTVLSEEHDLRLTPGQSVAVADYRLAFSGLKEVDGPNYQAMRGEFQVYEGEALLTTLYPEKRAYTVNRTSMTEAAIKPGLLHDLYVSLGEPLDGGAWAVRVYYKPLVRWIWLGALLMALGGALAVSDPRYRLARQQAKASLGKGVEAA
ncbi:MAG: heme lyase CcmF/NrfE family subunit [Gammaproteobacteria bacterium]|nr:heme lyase CcmF/NrfE family subunit [Gammaproteobacteria bacterium]